MRKRGTRYCPRCGAQNNEEDLYCTRCGNSIMRNFMKTRKKGLTLRQLIMGIIVILIIWVIIRFLLNSPLIPQELIDIFKNLTSNSTG